MNNYCIVSLNLREQSARTWKIAPINTRPESTIVHNEAVATDNQFVVITGGFNKKTVKILPDTSIYSLEDDKWAKGPDQNFPRAMHSFCYIGGHYYTFFGYSMRVDKLIKKAIYEPMNSIERLNASSR